MESASSSSAVPLQLRGTHQFHGLPAAYDPQLSQVTEVISPTYQQRYSIFLSQQNSSRRKNHHLSHWVQVMHWRCVDIPLQSVRGNPMEKLRQHAMQGSIVCPSPSYVQQAAPRPPVATSFSLMPLCYRFLSHCSHNLTEDNQTTPLTSDNPCTRTTHHAVPV